MYHFAVRTNVERLFLFGMGILFVGLFWVPFVDAAELDEQAVQETIEIKEKEVKAVAGEDRNVAIDRKVLFDASTSVVPEGEAPRYLWDFGDGTTSEGVDVTHTYVSPGDYLVTLTMVLGNETYTDDVSISAYEDIVLLITDGTPTNAQLESLRTQAARQGVLLDTLSATRQGAEYVVEGSLVEAMLEARERISKTDLIVMWTEGSTGVNILSTFAAKAANVEDLNFPRKGIVVVTDQPLTAISRLAQSAFDSIGPSYILLTGQDALSHVISARTPESALQEVRSSGVESRLIGVYSGRASELNWNNFMSYAVNLMINRGVPVENILLLLMLPVIATIVALARQLVGIKTFGIYTPSIITLTLVVTGLKLGLLVFVIILAVATAMRYIMRWFSIAYLPRMAIVLSSVSAALFIVLLGAAISDRVSVTAVSIFPLLVMVMLVERFVSAQVEKGLRNAIGLSLQTLLIAVVSFYLVTWTSFRTFVLAYPEVLLLVPIVNYLAGRFTGLRVSEYFRFRAVRQIDTPQTKE